MSRRLLALCCVLIVASAWATTVIPQTIEQLARNSSDVVEAQAIETHPEWNAEGKIIYTVTRFKVMKGLKGSAPSEVVVRQMGGSLGGVTQKVAGIRHFTVGQQAVLFLRPSIEASGQMVVTGLFQGNFAVVKSSGQTYVTNGTEEASAFDPNSHAVGSYKGSRMTLSELEQRVRSAK